MPEYRVGNPAAYEGSVGVDWPARSTGLENASSDALEANTMNDESSQGCKSASLAADGRSQWVWRQPFLVRTQRGAGRGGALAWGADSATSKAPSTNSAHNSNSQNR